MKVLILNHKVKNCGVYQYGYRLAKILIDLPFFESQVIDLPFFESQVINYEYKEVESLLEYIFATVGDYTHIIYNYHCSTMPWLNAQTIQKNVKNISISHESPDSFFDIKLSIDPNAPNGIPRPIYENLSFNKINLVPTFGSFGFGFANKGFDKIVKMVNEQYDQAIIRFVIPVAHFDPNNAYTHLWAADACRKQITKPGIVLEISHEFHSTEELLEFLGSNDMNIFLYDQMHGRGVSSTIDYALSVKKPIGISDSYMFRNIYSDQICLYKVSIAECMKNSTEYCGQFLEKYSHENVRKRFREIISL